MINKDKLVNELEKEIGEKYGEEVLDDVIKIIDNQPEHFIWKDIEEPPIACSYVLLSFSNYPIPLVGRYEEDENGGNYYIGDDKETCLSHKIFVNAWTELPLPCRD